MRVTSASLNRDLIHLSFTLSASSTTCSGAAPLVSIFAHGGTMDLLCAELIMLFTMSLIYRSLLSYHWNTSSWIECNMQRKHFLTQQVWGPLGSRWKLWCVCIIMRSDEVPREWRSGKFKVRSRSFFYKLGMLLQWYTYREGLRKKGTLFIEMRYHQQKDFFVILGRKGCF